MTLREKWGNLSEIWQQRSLIIRLDVHVRDNHELSYGNFELQKNCNKMVFGRSLFLKISKERNTAWLTDDIFSCHHLWV